jgi:isomerase DpgB
MHELSRLTDFYLEIHAGTALSGALIQTVAEVCDRVEDSKKDTAVLLRLSGGGGAYSHELGVHTVNRWERTLRRLERLPALTIAVVDDVCEGPALDLLLTTDYRISTPDSTLRAALVAGGTWPGMALHRLASQLGVARARRLGLLGMDVTAAQAAQWGLVDEVSDDPASAAREVLAALANRSGTELAIRRQLLSEAGWTSFEDATGAHLAACDRVIRLVGSGADAAGSFATGSFATGSLAAESLAAESLAAESLAA